MDTGSLSDDLGVALTDIRERTLIVSALLDQIDDWASTLPSDGMPEKLQALIITAREHAEEAFNAARDVTSRFG